MLQVVGVALTRELIDYVDRPGADLSTLPASSLMEDIVYVPETMSAMNALKLMRQRSEVQYEHGPWSELWDPQSNSLWYLNTRTWRTTWEAPAELRPPLDVRQRLVALPVEVVHVVLVLYVYETKLPEYGVAMATATIVPKRTPRRDYHTHMEAAHR